MDLVSLLRELRLLKGQAGYRFCMAWLVVAGHVCTRPPVISMLAVLYLTHFEVLDSAVAKGLLSLLSRTIVQIFRLR